MTPDLATKERLLAIHVAAVQTSEGQMLKTLRAELAAAEAALDAEHANAARSRKAIAAREADLQAQLSDAAAELAAVQRNAELRSAALAAAEERAGAAELEHEALNAKLIAAEERLRQYVFCLQYRCSANIPVTSRRR